MFVPKIGLPAKAKIAVGLILYIPVQMLVTALFSALGLPSLLRGPIWSEVLNTFEVVLGTLAMVALWDRRPLGGLGLAVDTKSPRRLVTGMLVGGALALVVWLVFVAGGWAKVIGLGGGGASPSPGDRVSAIPQALLPGLVVNLIIFLCGAITEEIIARGYILQGLKRLWGPYPALALSSAAFALFHAGYGGDHQVLFVVNVLLAGLLFGYAYLATASLWLPIGLHLGWNFTVGPLLGMAVSGSHHPPELIPTVVTGPWFVAGGHWGPEGGVVATVVLAAAVAVAAALLVKRQRC